MIRDFRILNILGDIEMVYYNEENLAYLKEYLDLITTQLEFFRVKATNEELKVLEDIKKELGWN